MTCPVLGQLCASRHSHPPRARLSKAASSYRPIAIDPEGLTVRDHCSLWIIGASVPSFFTLRLPYGTSWKPKRSVPPVLA
jgi:hypothetical protein